MKKAIKYILIALIAVPILAGIGIGIAIAISTQRADVPDPLLAESEEAIREHILALTPIGTNAEDVLVVLNENREKFFFGSASRDPDAQYDSIQTPSINSSSGYHTYYADQKEVVGEKSIAIKMGTHADKGEFFYTGVWVSWGFDGDSKLLDVYVYKETNAL